MSELAMLAWRPAPLAVVTESRRVRPAVALFFFSPLFAELLPGMSPFYEYFSLGGFIAAHLTYGLSAVLLREWAVHRHCGSWGRLLLGLALCLIIEGFVLKNIFAPEHYELPFFSGYARLLGINWHWLISMALWHSVLSLLLPWLLIDLLWPGLRQTPALTLRTTRVLASVLALTCIYSFFTTPMSWLGDTYVPNLFVTLASAALLYWLLQAAARIKDPRPRRGRALHPWVLGALCFAGWLTWWIGLTFLAALGPLAHRPLITVLLQLAFIALALGLAWTQRGLLEERHQYALLFGSLLPFTLLGFLRERDPLQVEILDPTGMGVVAALFVISALVLRSALLRRRKRLLRTTAAAAS